VIDLDGGNDATGGRYDATHETGGSGSSSGGSDSGDDGTTDATNDVTSDDGDDAADSGSPPSDASPYVVFVSSQFYTGNLGGLAGADEKCQSLASAVGLSGTFKAWLSSQGGGTAATRLSHGNAAYRLVDKTVVVDNWAGFTGGGLKHSIDKTEDGSVLHEPVDGSPECPGTSVWTSTDTSGGLIAAMWGGTCSDWSSAADANSGTTGSTDNWNVTSTAWTFWCHDITCDSLAALYCIQQ
jgi:hypothetical protein